MSTTKYTADHEWVRNDDDDTVTIGITQYAQEQLGDIVFVQLPEVGSRLVRGDEAVVIESVKAAADIKMPFAGEVVAVNDALTSAPETDRKSTRLNSSHVKISYAVFCLKKKIKHVPTVMRVP